MNHPCFGELNTHYIKKSPDVIWERELNLNGQIIEAVLWANQDQILDAAQIDAFAAMTQDLSGLDAHARAHLLATLEADDEFIAYHTDEVENFPGVAAIAPDGEVMPDVFMQAMKLTNIGLWAEAVPDGLVILDYQIDPEHSDQILAVKITDQGKLVAVDWES